MKKRGKFVVMEGGLGSGKTTQFNKFRENYPNWKFYREPGSTEFGERVRDAVQGSDNYEVHPCASLFAYSSARANLVKSVIIPDLKKGHNVLLDRYWYSTFAYQGAEGVSKPLIWAVSFVATGGLKPNAVLHYNLLSEIGMERKKGESDIDRYDARKVVFHRKVRANYLMLSRLCPGIWRTIDASRTKAQVYQDSIEALNQLGII